MKNLTVKLMWACLLFSITAFQALAEPYLLVAGSSVMGFRENEKENVMLGFTTAFNTVLAQDEIKCNFKVFENSDDLANAIARKELNSFFGSPVEFFKSESRFLKAPLAGAIFGEKSKAKIFLVVRNDSGIESLQQLKGKKLSAHNLIIDDLIGLYLETLLLERGLPPMERFFSEILYSETSNRAFVDLFFKKVDASIMTERQYEVASELNPQLRKQTKIIESSEPYLIFIAALTKETPKEVAEIIKHNLYNIHKTPKGRHILNLMRMHSFVEVSISDLDNLRALLEKNKRLKANNNAK